MGNRLLKLASILWLAAVLLIATAPAASAACHRFDLELSQTTADEGDSITVTVRRDGALADSGVRVTASGGLARSGADYSPLDQQVNFTGDSTERTFQITIASDSASEAAETFNVSLSQPSGCAVNPNFQLASPVTVRINASQAPPAPAPPAPRPAPPPPPAPAPAPAPPASPTVTGSPTEEASPEPTDTATPTPTPTGDNDDDGGGGIPPQVIIGGLALLGAIGTGVWLYRQRGVTPPGI